MNILSLCSYSEARSIIEQGELLIYPTETYYALGTAWLSPQCDTIYTIKQRPRHKALPLIVHSIEQAYDIVHIAEQAHSILTHFPAVTIVLPSRRSIDTIALRIATTPLLQYLTQSTPIVATSANKSGTPPAAHHTELDTNILNGIPICLPSSLLDSPQGKAPSTILAVQKTNILLLRHGSTPLDILYKYYPSIIDSTS